MSRILPVATAILALLLIKPAVSTGQVTIFSENMGTPSGTTAIAANTFQNGGLTFVGTADVRTSTASSGYTGASAGGNVFVTNAVGRYLEISGINTVGYTSLTLSLGHYKSTTASSNELQISVSSDGSSYTNLTYTRPTGTGTASWLLITPSGTIPATANLRIRFEQTSTSPQFRIDDVKLTGIIPVAPAITVSPGLLTGFSTTQGTPSASQSFTVEGDNLSGNLSVAAVAGFEYSLNNTSFTSTIPTITVSGGNVVGEPVTVYVRLTGAASGSPSGNAVVSGGGASAQNVSLSGTVCPNTGSFSVGDISFVGMSTDDPDQFSFVNWVSIPNGATLNFTENAWDGSALATNEGTVTWENNTGGAIAPGTVILFELGTGFDLGTESASSGSFALSTGQDNLFVYEGTSTCPRFIHAISNDAWVVSGGVSTNNTYLPTSLNVANGNVNMPATTDNWEFTNPRNDQASIAAYKSIVNNTANWTGNNSLFTLSSTDFTVASSNPSVELSASAGSGSEAAASVITITATASAPVTGNQTITLAVSGTGITTGDYTISSGGVITILNGQTVGSITFTIVDDALFEGTENAIISYTSGSLSAGLVAGTVTSVQIGINDNDAATLYSQASGGTNSAIWDLVPNGTGQTAASLGGFSPNTNVVIQSGHTVDITVSGVDMKNLTIQSGAKFFANNTAMNGSEYVRLYGNITNAGSLGNGSTPDNISFELRGTDPMNFTGNGTFDIGRIRKETGVTGSLTIDANVNLGFEGACLFVNGNNLSLDVVILAGKTVSITSALGDVAIDGTNGANGGERGGSITVNGTLNVGNKLYALSNNTTLPCSITIGSSGKIIAKNVDLNINGTGFTGFNIVPGGQLIMNGILSVQGGTLASNGGVVLNNGAQLLHGAGTTGGGGSVTGNIIVKRQGTTSQTVYNYWSSPVASGTVPGINVYSYNSSNGTQDYGDDLDPDPGWEGFSGTMTPGKGYAGAGAGLASFTGVANNGNIPYAMTFFPFSPGNTAAGTPFNLVGNPYPGAISASAFVAGNSNINGSLYFWDDDLSGGSGYSYTDYAIWNGTGSLGTGAGTTAPNGQIASCQGFLVRALNGASVTFTNAMRSGGNNGQFFKPAEEPSRLWLALEGNNQYNEILIGMMEDATEGEDRLYDAVKLRGNTSIALASVNDGYEYAILAFPPIQSERIVPLVAQVVAGGTYSFNPHTMEGFDGYDVYLEDRLNSTFTLIQEGLSVPVAMTAGESIDRFYLHFSPFNVTSVTDPETNAELKTLIGRDEIALVLTGSESMVGSLELISANGQLLSTSSSLTLSNSPTMMDLSNLSTGVYLIRFVSESRSYVTRFIKN